MSLSALFVGQNSRNDMDEGLMEGKEREKKLHYLLKKRTRGGSNHRSSQKGKSRKKRGGQVRIFIHIHSKWHSGQKLHIYFSFLHRCTVVLL